MKKLLAILFVLAITSLANATVSMWLSGDSTPGSGTISLYVVPEPVAGTSTTAQLDLSMAICIKSATAVLVSSALGHDAPSDSADTDVSMADMDAALGTSLVATYGNGEIWSFMSYTSVYPEGVWLTVHYSGVVWGDSITAYQSVDGNFDDVDLQSNTLPSPEPATITLLCLGGLMLRRKK